MDLFDLPEPVTRDALPLAKVERVYSTQPLSDGRSKRVRTPRSEVKREPSSYEDERVNPSLVSAGDFSVMGEHVEGMCRVIVQDVSLRSALRYLTRPFESCDEGFRETKPRWRPTPDGVLTERRILICPQLSLPSRKRLARHLRIT